MKTIQVKVPYYDTLTKKQTKVGDIYEVSDERYEQIMTHPLGLIKLVESVSKEEAPINQIKTPKKKAPAKKSREFKPRRAYGKFKKKA